MAKHDKDVALFIDWENIRLSMRKLHPKELLKIQDLLQVASRYGHLLVARAYAAWPYFEQDQLALYTYGIEPVYVPFPGHSYGEAPCGEAGQGAKTTTDTRLVVDALDWVRNHPRVPTVIIASGDGGFVHLSIYLQQVLNRRVIGVGITGASSKLLREAVDEWVYLDGLALPGRAPTAEPLPPPVTDDKLQQAFARLRTVVHEQWAHAASQGFPAIHQRLMAYGFDFRALGFEQFKEFMFAAQAQGIVKVVQNGLQYSAYPPEEEVVTASSALDMDEQGGDTDKVA
jgi:hypothetical protein